MPALPWSLHSHPSRPRRRKAPHTYFVGRRVLEATELFAVSAADVERLTSDRRYGAPGLDWRGGDTALELSHLLLERVAEPPPSRELTTHFARSMLAPLPEHGFVLDSDTVWKWHCSRQRSRTQTFGRWWYLSSRQRQGGANR
jgi:hypothetical protein